jgi:hypothetical protein
MKQLQSGVWSGEKEFYLNPQLIYNYFVPPNLDTFQFIVYASNSAGTYQVNV